VTSGTYRSAITTTMSTNHDPADLPRLQINDEQPGLGVDLSFGNYISEDSTLPDLTNGSTQQTWNSVDHWLNRKQQDDILMEFFKKSASPDASEIMELTIKTGLLPSDVEEWFRSHRNFVAYFGQVHPEQLSLPSVSTSTGGLGGPTTSQSGDRRFKEDIFPAGYTANTSGVLFHGETSGFCPRPSKRQKTVHETQNPAIGTGFLTTKHKPLLQCVGADGPCQKRFQTSERTQLCNHENNCHFPVRAFRCDLCSSSKWFSKASNGENHLVSVHNFVKGPHLKRYFERHVHRIDHMFHDTCGFEGCTETFQTRGKSVEHIRNHSEQGSIRSQWTHRCSRLHKLEDHPDNCHCDSDYDGDSNDNSNGGDDNDHQGSQDENADPDATHRPGEGSPGQGGSGNNPKDGSGGSDREFGPERGGQGSYRTASIKPTSTNTIMEEVDGLDRQPVLGNISGKSKTHSSGTPITPTMTSGRILGTGAFGTVYEIKIRPKNRRYLDEMSAPKVFARKIFAAATSRAGVRDAFEQERTVLSLLDNRHPHIIQYFGSSHSKDNFEILLGPVADMNLAQYLKSCLQHESNALHKAQRRGHKLFAEKLLDRTTIFDTQRDTQLSLGCPNALMRSIGCLASAVAFLHRTTSKHGPIIHGDIKPSNILVFLGNNISTGNLRLADFGTASVLSLGRERTETRRKAFTRSYQPPECIGKHLPPRRSFDIWSLGCVFIEVLTLVQGENRYAKGAECAASWQMRAKGWLLEQETDHARSMTEERLLYNTALEIVLRMLSLNPSERPTARAVVSSLPLKCECAVTPVAPLGLRSQSLDVLAPLPSTNADVFEFRIPRIGLGKDLRTPSKWSCQPTRLPEYTALIHRPLLARNSICLLSSLAAYDEIPRAVRCILNIHTVLPMTDSFASYTALLHTVLPMADSFAPYAALSYVWGSPDDSQSTQVNDFEVMKLSDVYYALLGLLRVVFKSLLWVGSSRTVEVALTKKIFSEVAQSLSWLGYWDTDPSDGGMKLPRGWDQSLGRSVWFRRSWTLNDLIRGKAARFDVDRTI
jgi:serine/threonine protein kinase